LSESPSPALAPCGIPFELEPDELEEVELVAAGVDELCVDELLEFDPQAATTKAASTSIAAAQRRGDRIVVVFMVAPVSREVWNLTTS
jgi:hypothetical protein